MANKVEPDSLEYILMERICKGKTPSKNILACWKDKTQDRVHDQVV